MAKITIVACYTLLLPSNVLGLMHIHGSIRREKTGVARANHFGDQTRLLSSSSSNDESSAISRSRDCSNSTTGRFLSLQEEGTHALDLLDQAEKVKADIRRMQQEVAQRKVDQLAKEDAAIDKWIQDLLFATPSSRNASSNTQLLKTVDQVAQALEDGRYSFEQVNKIFRKLSQNVRKKRINQGLEEQPLLQLLVEACGKMDCLDRNENSNKRWNGRVERALRRKVMALEWGIDSEDEPDG